MLSSILSCGLTGIDGFSVTAEVNLMNGMPMFEIVGLPDASVKESRERVRAASKNSGYGFPAARLTVNLAPADLKKEGPSFDLPIALGTLCCCGVFPPEALRFPKGSGGEKWEWLLPEREFPERKDRWGKIPEKTYFRDRKKSFFRFLRGIGEEKSIGSFPERQKSLPRQ